MQLNSFRRASRSLTALAVLALQATAASAQLPSFSGAEGFGGTFTGSAPSGGWFSNATVYHVTTTQDLTNPSTGKPAIGTLRGAFYDYTNPNSPKQLVSNRIVVFDVGGTFDISAAKLDIKTVNNIYIAGQTAPSPVTVYGNMAQITKSGNTQTSNVILRYMTFRKGTGAEEDALSFTGGDGVASGDTIARNMILDHVTASWSEDENISVTNNNTDVTVQYSIIHDALVNNHAYGSLIRPKVDSNVSFHHNLYANNASRQARFGSYLSETLTADFRNNVIYNWRDRASYAGGSDEADQEFADVNYVGNYLVAGPGTVANANTGFIVDKNVTARVHQYGNAIDSNGPAVPDGQVPDATGVYNGVDNGWGMFALNSPVTDQTLQHMDLAQFPTAPVTTQAAAAAYNQVLSYVGNYWWSRDAIDTRVVNNVRNFTGPSLAATSPIAAELAGVTTAPTTTRAAGWDTDQDGMPDVWEVAHGLNPSSNLDFKTDVDSDGYVNLQEYVDEVGAFPAPTPLTYSGAANGPTARFALITNWKTSDVVVPVAPPNNPIIYAGTNWQPSRFDEARINNGTVLVDAVGQHADTLKLANNSGDNATLNITNGWLDIAHELVIGADPGATAALNLSGGVLSAPRLSKGAGGSFNFTGGTLHADTVNFDLVNNGGILAPGHSVGHTHVVGDFTLASGTLQIELSSALLADSLLIDGSAALGGSLSIFTLGGFTPTNGTSWQIITAGGITGQFASITSGYSVQQQGNNLFLFFGTAPLAGDYNGDGAVNAADYVVWRHVLAAGGTLLNETASPGVVDDADYAAWRNNFGASAGAGSGVTLSAAVPEPSACAMLFAAILIGICKTSRRHV